MTYLSEHRQLVLLGHIVMIRHNHPCKQTTERRDAVPLAYAEYAGVDMSCSGLERAVCICNSTAPEGSRTESARPCKLGGMLNGGERKEGTDVSL